MAHTVSDTAQGAMSVGLSLLTNLGEQDLHGGNVRSLESPKL